ncbi:radical SAM domain protein [Chryseobacterium sp. StRB126]|uniref:hypothetical protein n=1 Tax=Chryseobacterium sp. StRB126 TaxID=878220 RepID=UPI0004E999D5|nr:hypothetical protein [Chryseobacterium sp. StRB126]BAP30144.1 radical SAM domain protein [Chryseobacterium sp. StRB126]
MNTKVQKISYLENVNVETLDFSLHLNDITALDPTNDNILYHFCLFNKDLMFWPYMFNKLISRDEFLEFKNVEEYAYNALKEEQLSRFQIKSICDLSEILSEAKLLREIGVIKNYEFVEIFMQVRGKLFQKYSAIKKAYLKKQIKDKGITKNSAQRLRAKLACLNEN